ncbi:uncharacterized protein LOC135838091 [Planococcus citri]|uniref:uncharacterized protein LOC135838091 n=1 Tax=Planococcus citri TaxID=170843 RepID=UPI0031F84398
MRFISSCCGEVSKYRYLTTTHFSSYARKWDRFNRNSNFKIPYKQLSTKPQQSPQNLSQDFFQALAKADALYSSNFNRNLLYPETNDEIINQLKSCYDFEEVVRIINANESLSHQQLSQVVLVLRDLQKFYAVHNVLVDDGLKISHLRDSPSFSKLLALLESNIEKMNVDESSCCLLYLRKLNVKCTEPAMKKLIDACENSFLNLDKASLLQNLTRFFIAIKEENNIWSLYTMSQYLPFLLESLDVCENHDEFRHITACFQKCVPLLNSDILNKYIAKLDLILQPENENDDLISKTRTILKAIIFLNFKHWNCLYINEVKRLMAAMKGNLHYLCPTEMSILHKEIINMQEPFDLAQEIEKTTKNWMKTNESAETAVPIFVFQALFPAMKLMDSADVKNSLIKCMEKNSCSRDVFLHFSDFHELIFNTDLKYDRKITTKYWVMVINKLKHAKQQNGERLRENVLWTIHKYIHLIGQQKNLRNEYIEKSLVSFIIDLLHDDKQIHCPADYSKYYLTILAITHKNPFHFFTDAVWQKLRDNFPRLTVYDRLFLSLVLRIAHDRFMKHQQGLDQFLHFHVYLNTVANAKTFENLKCNPDLTVERLNTFLFSFILTKGIKTSEIFDELCKRFRQIEIDQIHSKIIRDCVFNFTASAYLIPEFTQVMVDYCIKEKNAMFGGAVASLLNYCFLFGFVPKNIDQLLSIGASVIDRDKDSIPQMLYLRSAVALSYFRELPSSWSDYIFNITFLEQLDKCFLKLNFRKANELRRELMELNRIVCIDYPHREVPWFHGKYCQEVVALERTKRNDFLTSVLDVVKSLVTANTAIDINHTTPYGHKIDVVLHLSKDGESTNVKDCDPAKMRKVALLLRSYLPSEYYKGKGRLELFSRQLEMLNFEVVLLSKQEWNSLYLSNLEEKKNYLRKLIWPT